MRGHLPAHIRRLFLTLLLPRLCVPSPTPLSLTNIPRPHPTPYPPPSVWVHPTGRSGAVELTGRPTVALPADNARAGSVADGGNGNNGGFMTFQTPRGLIGRTPR